MTDMIRTRRNKAKPWTPQGFERYAEIYPHTQWDAPRPQLDRSAAFRECWVAAGDSELPREHAIVLTPGLFAEWLPSCFRLAESGFRQGGYRTLRTRVSTAFDAVQQAQRLERTIDGALHARQRFVWCTHSKGGLDALVALNRSESLRDRCIALAMVQPPTGPSCVLQRFQENPQGLRESLTGRLLRSRWFAGGVREVSALRSEAIDRALRGDCPVPLVHVVSWSCQPTSALDSYHRQLNAIRPGHAHDGQFYLNDQRIQRAPIVCLPELDHAQPVLGGLGFNVARFWSTLVSLAWDEAGGGGTRDAA